jgi:hypothetical protein
MVIWGWSLGKDQPLLVLPISEAECWKHSAGKYSKRSMPIFFFVNSNGFALE